MREPSFTDAWCFGKEFEAKSKICRVCLANKPCQKKFYKALGATSPQAEPLLASAPGSRRAYQKPVELLPQPLGDNRMANGSD
jgi:hypothetical protein